METITFRCTSCKFVLRVGADKVGRNAKCSKCGTPLKIPATSDAEPAAPIQPEAAAAKKLDDDDDGPAAYGLKETPDPAEARREQEESKAPKVLKKSGRVQVKKQAKITNPEEWRKVGFGARIVAVGLCIWLAAYGLYRVPLILGMAMGEEFAAAADTRLAASPVDSGKAPDLDLSYFAVALVGGKSWDSIMMLVCRVALVLQLLQYGPLLVGYVLCQAVPDRFGTRLQLKILLGLASLNAIILIVFKLLPMLGIVHYTLLPFVMPEIAMGEMNADRMQSVETFWLKSPVLEVYGAILLTLLSYLELAMIATFVWSVGQGVKSGPLESQGLMAMKLAFSQVFIQAAWLMASLCGTSVVLLWSLRLVYTVGAAFFVFQIVFTVVTLLGVAGVVEEQLGDEESAAPVSGEDE